LQAMACEVPIAASCASSIPEIVDEAALPFDPYNIRSIARALEKIITDRQLRAHLVAAGNERIKSFSWEKCAQETLAEINKL
jgi:glycosyltransferase involved in cell wall biosynthesis